MRKLKLDLADLTVDSFETRMRWPKARGTLFGQSGHDTGTEATICWGLTCPECGDTAYVFCTAQCGGDTGACGGGGSGDTCTCAEVSTCADCPDTGLCTSRETGC
ncbi:MAG TPA: hypothetical protein VF771_20755 [Longimicrobiaceae bacterium]